MRKKLAGYENGVYLCSEKKHRSETPYHVHGASLRLVTSSV